MPDREDPGPVRVQVTPERLTVDLSDGRTIAVPTDWYPRLAHGTSEEWERYELGAWGILWPEIDEDISVEALL